MNIIFLFLSTAICYFFYFCFFEKQKGYCQNLFQFASAVDNWVSLILDYYQPPGHQTTHTNSCPQDDVGTKWVM